MTKIWWFILKKKLINLKISSETKYKRRNLKVWGQTTLHLKFALRERGFLNLWLPCTYSCRRNPRIFPRSTRSRIWWQHWWLVVYLQPFITSPRILILAIHIQNGRGRWLTVYIFCMTNDDAISNTWTNAFYSNRVALVLCLLMCATSRGKSFHLTILEFWRGASNWWRIVVFGNCAPKYESTILSPLFGWLWLPPTWYDERLVGSHGVYVSHCGILRWSSRRKLSFQVVLECLKYSLFFSCRIRHTK